MTARSQSACAQPVPGFSFAGSVCLKVHEYACQGNKDLLCCHTRQEVGHNVCSMLSNFTHQVTCSNTEPDITQCGPSTQKHPESGATSA